MVADIPRGTRERSRGRRRFLCLAALVAAVTTVAGAACGSASAPGGAGGRVTVVAAENVWGDIAAQVGGSRVTVISIISDPGADPHTYETNPRDAAMLTTAQLVIENGAGYDDFVDRVLSTDPSTTRALIDVAASVGAGGSSRNPHLWYDPTAVTTVARVIEARLEAADPAGGAAFAANLRSFLTDYQPYIDTLQVIRARHRGAAIGYTERVAGYLVTAAGLRLATPASFAQAVEDGNDPSPADTAAMDTAITTRQVRLLLYNSQVRSPVTERVKQLAVSAGIPVVGVAETLPAGQPGFAAWQTAQAAAILAALGG